MLRNASYVVQPACHFAFASASRQLNILHQYYKAVWLKYRKHLLGFLPAMIPIYVFILMFTEGLPGQIVVLGLGCDSDGFSVGCVHVVVDVFLFIFYCGGDL